MSGHAFVDSSFLKLLARTLAYTVIAPELVKQDSGIGLLTYLVSVLTASLLEERHTGNPWHVLTSIT